MMEKQKNIMEDVAREFLNNAIMLRYDICTCILCRQDMLTQVLADIPAEYRLSEAISPSVIEQIKQKHKGALAKAAMNAIMTVSANPKHKLTEDKAEAFKLLLNNILEDRNLDFRQYNQGVIRRKIGFRMHMNSVTSYLEYARFLRKDPDEYEKLLSALCINVSEFFRDIEVWVTIRYLLENLINQKKLKNDKSIRLWSAGCASGEEPYSLAMVLKELLKTWLPDFSLEIHATDIDKKCLAAAHAGIYDKNAVKNLEAKHLKNYFIAQSDGNYQVKDEIKKMVKFQYLDLIKQDFIKETDVILCRNVFIYFNRELQLHLLRKFHQSLKAGGYLVKGKAETIINEVSGCFEDVDSNARIYKKIGA